MSGNTRKRKTREEILKERRELRRDLGARGSVMALPEEEGKEFRWVNNQLISGVNRIQRMQELGWQIWHAENTEVDESTGATNIQSGTGGRLVVGLDEKHEPMEAVVMWIDKDIYDADQALKAERVDDLEDDIQKRPSQDGLYGNVRIGEQ